MLECLRPIPGVLPMTDARLTALEIALAHQERLGEELSDVVRAQADRLAQVERRLAAALERIEALEAAAPPPASSRPPHW